MQLLTLLRRKSVAYTLALATLCAPAQGQTGRTTYTITTFAGGSLSAEGAPATQVALIQPEGVAVDAQGNIFVADAADNRVRKITPDGLIYTYAGTGDSGSGADGVAANTAALRNPYGIALDRAGDLFIADLGNGRVRKVTPDGIISTVAGGGTAAPANGAPATSVKLASPRNVAVDSSGTLYFSDFGANRVYQVSLSGLLTITGGNGHPDHTGDGGPAIQAGIGAPAGVAVDSQGNLYVADTVNRSVRKIAGGILTTVGGPSGTPNWLPVRIPIGVSIDSTGNLYVQDTSAQTFRVTPQGTIFALQIGGTDLTFDVQGKLYVTGSHVVRVFWNSNLTTLAGSLNSTIGDGGPAALAKFAAPLGLGRDGSGSLLIADSANKRVRKIDAQGSTSTIAGTSASGADGLLPTTVHLASPAAVALNARGEVFVADAAANQIRRIGLDGNMATIAGSSQPGATGDGWFAVHALLNGPAALATDQNENVYVADTGNDRIRKITPEGLIFVVAGGGTAGLGDNGPAFFASLSKPQGVAAASGNLYISDTGNSSVRVVDKNGVIRTLADKSAGLLSPRGIRADSNGSVLVADAGANRIFRISASGTVEILAGAGAAGYAGDAGQAAAALLRSPQDLLQDPSGAIWVADTGNNCIRKLTPAVTSAAPPPGAVTKLTVLHGATLQEQPVAPGEVVTLMGIGLGPALGVLGKVTADGLLDTQAGGTKVLFDTFQAPIFYAQDKQINAQVPFEIAGRTETQVTVVYNGTLVASTKVSIKTTVPGLVTAGGGLGQAIALNQDGSINGPAAPAPRASILAFFATGDGQVDNKTVDGKPTDAIPLTSPVSVTIGGSSAQIFYAGRAPGEIGVLQINAAVPAGLSSGPQEVKLVIGGVSSQAGVVVSVK